MTLISIEALEQGLTSPRHFELQQNCLMNCLALSLAQAFFCCGSQFQGELPSLRILLTAEINCQELLLILLNNLETVFKLSKQKTIQLYMR